MALYLYRTGARLVGTPSAQAPNSWGELLEWQLNYSGIKGEVSSAFGIAFGDDPERGRVLPVHYPLTYEKLISFKFDINSEFLYAMELFSNARDLKFYMGCTFVPVRVRPPALFLLHKALWYTMKSLLTSPNFQGTILL
jgi:hypothetical protein